MAAFGSAIGVAIALAVVTFALRGKGHPEEPEANKSKIKKEFSFLFIIFLFYNLSRISCCPKSLYLHRKSLSSFPSLSLYNIFQNIGILYNQ